MRPKRPPRKSLRLPYPKRPKQSEKAKKLAKRKLRRARRRAAIFLTGQGECPRDISDVRGNVIIRKGSVITPEILKSAIFHNKLFELTVTVLNAD